MRSLVKDKEAALAEISLLLAVLFLGTNPVAVKVAVRDVPQLPFVSLRFVLAGVVLLTLVLLLKEERPQRRDLLSMTAVGVVGVGLNNIAFTFGVSLTTASETALIYAAVPVWGMILGASLGLERPTPIAILGVALAFVGVGVIVYSSLGEEASSFIGDLLVVVATVCWASYAVLSLPLLRRHTPLTIAAYTMLFGGLAALPVALPSFFHNSLGAVSSTSWAATAYSTLFVAAYGFFAWQRGVSRIGANRVLVYQYLIVLIGVVAGVMLLGESLTINKIIGGVVILLGVYLARRQ